MYRARVLQRLGRNDEAIRDFSVVASMDARNLEAVREVRLHQAREDHKAALAAGLWTPMPKEILSNGRAACPLSGVTARRERRWRVGCPCHSPAEQRHTRQQCRGDGNGDAKQDADQPRVQHQAAF